MNQGNRNLLIVLGVVVVVILGAVFALRLLGPGDLDVEGEGATDSRAVFRGSDDSVGEGASLSPVDEATRSAAHRMLEQMGAAMVAGEGEKAMSHWDVAGMLAVAEQRGMCDPIPSKVRRLLITQFPVRQAARLNQTGWIEGWHEVQLRRVERTERDNLLIVHARCRNHNLGSTVWMKFWLRRSGSTWRMYDYQELSMGVRISTMTGVGLKMAKAGQTQEARSLQQLITAMTQFRQDPEQVVSTLEGLASQPVPAGFESLKWMMVAAVRLDQDDFDGSLDAVKRSREASSEMLATYSIEAGALNGLGRYDEAIEVANRFIELLGPDADCLYEIGFAKLKQGDAEAAKQAFTDGLADNLVSGSNFLGLVLLTPDMPDEQIKSALKAAPDLTTLLAGAEWVVDDLEARPSLLRIVEVADQIKPNDELIAEMKELYAGEPEPF